ncbi:von willebrand factor a [Pelomyxa schiedti]|nr:von willebrand factor a [Pelomyxa schiedti]
MSSTVTINVVGLSCDTTITKGFRNDQENPVEVVVNWFHSRANVYSLVAQIGDKIIEGKSVESSKANDTYDDAVASSRTALLGALENDPLLKERLSFSLGNVPPHCVCSVKLSYVEELVVGAGCLVKIETPLTALTFSGGLKNTTGETTVSLNLAMPRAIIGVNSTNEEFIKSKEGLVGETLGMEFISSKADGSFSASVLLTPSVPVMLTAVRLPSTPSPEDTNAVVCELSYSKHLAIKDSSVSTMDTDVDIIFIVDQSGSMSGKKITQASNAVALMLASLPIGCQFNVVGFGSDFGSVFETSRAYGDETLALAREYTLQMGATRGGTRLLPPIQFVFNTCKESMRQRPLKLFVLTDGQVDDTVSLLQFVVQQTHNTPACVFSFGIGNDVSRNLVSGLASASGGKAVFITDKDEIEGPVLSQLAAALGSTTRNLGIEWGSPMDKVIPAAMPSVLTEEMTATQHTISRSESTISATITYTGLQTPLQINATALSPMFSSLLGRIAAAREIKALTDLDNETPQEDIKRKVIELATKHNFVSRYTSLVAVERSSTASVDGSMTSVVIAVPVVASQIVVPTSTSSSSSQASRKHHCHKHKALRTAPDSSSSIPASAVRKGNFVVMNGHIVQVTETSTSKTGKHGHAKMHITAIDPSTGKKYETIETTSSNIDQGDIQTQEYDLLDADSSSDLITLLESDGNTREIILKGALLEKARRIVQAGGTAQVRVARSISIPDLETVLSITSTDTPDDVLSQPTPQPQPQVQSQPQPQPQVQVQPIPVPQTQPQVHSSSATSSRMSPLNKLCFLQKAQGYWELNSTLTDILEAALSDATSCGDTIITQITAHFAPSVSQQTKHNLWATALAIAALELLHKDQETQWKLIKAKAVQFLQANISSPTALEQFITNATTFLTTHSPRCRH